MYLPLFCIPLFQILLFTMARESPFTKEQEAWIIIQFGKLERPVKVRRKFRIEYKIDKKKIPSQKQFTRVHNRFLAAGSVGQQKPGGRPVSKTTEENIALVKEMVVNNPRMSIRDISKEVDMSYKTTWKIMRKELSLYPYKPKKVQPLTQAHKNQRIAFSDWISQKTPEFIDCVIFSDEKLWEEKIHPNRQNERYWGKVDPEVEVDCKVQGGKKIMSWAAMINGQVILHWFPPNTSVNQDVYLDMLKSVLWPAVKGVATRKQYWFQQDGAMAHTTVMVRDWLKTKFGSRIISRFTDHPWPSRSPDLSPLDFWFWSVCLEELRRCPPRSLEELQDTVTIFADTLSREEVTKSARNILIRARACKEAAGGVFEYKLKKFKRKSNNEE